MEIYAKVRTEYGVDPSRPTFVVDIMELCVHVNRCRHTHAHTHSYSPSPMRPARLKPSSSALGLHPVSMAMLAAASASGASCSCSSRCLAPYDDAVSSHNPRDKPEKCLHDQQLHTTPTPTCPSPHLKPSSSALGLHPVSMAMLCAGSSSGSSRSSSRRSLALCEDATLSPCSIFASRNSSSLASMAWQRNTGSSTTSIRTDAHKCLMWFQIKCS